MWQEKVGRFYRCVGCKKLNVGKPTEKCPFPEHKKYYDRHLFLKKESYERHKQEVALRGAEYYRQHKDTISAYGKAYFRQHHDEMLKQNRERARQQRLLVLGHYGGNPPKCTCCGETAYEFLTIDHIDGHGNKHRLDLGSEGRSFYLWMIRMGLPAGFRVLCLNCNFALGHYGYCPHTSHRV